MIFTIYFRLTLVLGLCLLSGFFTQATPTDGPKTYVVIAAIADYKNLGPRNDLKLTINDARRFYSFLRTRVPSNQMRFLIEQNATRAQILKQIDYLFSFARPQDRVIFYFSGHGDSGFFLPYDYDNRPSTALRHKDVKAAFKRCRATTKLCIADACRSASINKPRDRGNQPVLRTSQSGIMVLTACRDNETAIEVPSLKQGLFSYYLIQALGGQADQNRDYVVNARELFSYLSQNVTTHASRNRHNQHPVAYGRFDDTMPIVNLR